MTGARHLEHDWFPRPLPDNVELGEGAWLYSSYAFIRFRSLRPVGCRIGRAVGVYVGTTFDLGVDAEVEIGDFSTLAGPLICTDGRVTIGRHSLISYLVTIADSPVAVPPFASGGDDRPPELRGSTEGAIEIGDDTWVGVGAVILRGAKLGDGVIVGAASVVDFDVPPYSIVAGNPARVVGHAPPAAGGASLE